MVVRHVNLRVVHAIPAEGPLVAVNGGVHAPGIVGPGREQVVLRIVERVVHDEVGRRAREGARQISEREPVVAVETDRLLPVQSLCAVDKLWIAGDTRDVMPVAGLVGPGCHRAAARRDPDVGPQPQFRPAAGQTVRRGTNERVRVPALDFVGELRAVRIREAQIPAVGIGKVGIRETGDVVVELHHHREVAQRAPIRRIEAGERDLHLLRAGQYRLQRRLERARSAGPDVRRRVRRHEREVIRRIGVQVRDALHQRLLGHVAVAVNQHRPHVPRRRVVRPVARAVVGVHREHAARSIQRSVQHRVGRLDPAGLAVLDPGDDGGGVLGVVVRSEVKPVLPLQPAPDQVNLVLGKDPVEHQAFRHHPGAALTTGAPHAELQSLGVVRTARTRTAGDLGSAVSAKTGGILAPLHRRHMQAPIRQDDAAGAVVHPAAGDIALVVAAAPVAIEMGLIPRADETAFGAICEPRYGNYGIVLVEQGLAHVDTVVNAVKLHRGQAVDGIHDVGGRAGIQLVHVAAIARLVAPCRYAAAVTRVIPGVAVPVEIVTRHMEGQPGIQRHISVTSQFLGQRRREVRYGRPGDILGIRGIGDVVVALAPEQVGEAFADRGGRALPPLGNHVLPTSGRRRITFRVAPAQVHVGALVGDPPLDRGTREVRAARPVAVVDLGRGQGKETAGRFAPEVRRRVHGLEPVVVLRSAGQTGGQERDVRLVHVLPRAHVRIRGPCGGFVRAVGLTPVRPDFIVRAGRLQRAAELRRLSGKRQGRGVLDNRSQRVAHDHDARAAGGAVLLPSAAATPAAGVVTGCATTVLERAVLAWVERTAATGTHHGGRVSPLVKAAPAAPAEAPIAGPAGVLVHAAATPAGPVVVGAQDGVLDAVPALAAKRPAGGAVRGGHSPGAATAASARRAADTRRGQVAAVVAVDGPDVRAQGGKSGVGVAAVAEAPLGAARAAARTAIRPVSGRVEPAATAARRFREGHRVGEERGRTVGPGHLPSTTGAAAADDHGIRTAQRCARDVDHGAATAAAANPTAAAATAADDQELGVRRAIHVERVVAGELVCCVLGAALRVVRDRPAGRVAAAAHQRRREVGGRGEASAVAVGPVRAVPVPDAVGQAGQVGRDGLALGFLTEACHVGPGAGGRIPEVVRAPAEIELRRRAAVVHQPPVDRSRALVNPGGAVVRVHLRRPERAEARRRRLARGPHPPARRVLGVEVVVVRGALRQAGDLVRVVARDDRGGAGERVGVVPLHRAVGRRVVVAPVHGHGGLGRARRSQRPVDPCRVVRHARGGYVHDCGQVRIARSRLHVAVGVEDHRRGHVHVLGPDPVGGAGDAGYAHLVHDPVEVVATAAISAEVKVACLARCSATAPAVERHAIYGEDFVVTR